MKGPSVFLSYTWSDIADIGRIERALRRRGVNVFRDVDLHKFNRISAELAAAIDSSAILLAFYSARYPSRYACQWELTRAFLAARRLGNPADRVLVVNPEANENHIAPVELTDASYFDWFRDNDADQLAKWVSERVGAVGSTPLGAPPTRDDDLSRLDPRLLLPQRFVGRYQDMWAVHSALHGGMLPAARKPHPHSVAVLKGPRGTGKRSTAKQYAFLFRDAYPGGVLWLPMAGDGETPTEDTVTARFAAQLRAATRSADLAGLEPDRVNAVVGDRLSETGEDVLIVVDDIPSGLEPPALERLVVPSSKVHTLLTARSITPGWPVRTVELGGLTDIEAEELFRSEWQELDDSEREAIQTLAAGCGGNPHLLTVALDKLIAAKGTRAVELLASELGPLVAAEVDLVAEQVRARDLVAQLVLGFAAALAPAPFPGELVTSGLVASGQADAAGIADALADLATHSMLRRMDDQGSPTWQLHAQVAQAARRELGEDLSAELARAAARAVTGWMHAMPDTPHLHLHARRVAANAAVPTAERLDILRAEAALHEDHGDAPAARDAMREVVQLSAEEWHTEDRLTAARLAVDAEDTGTAIEYATALIRRAAVDGDERTEYHARFLAGRAYDIAGRYHEADKVFYQYPEDPDHQPRNSVPLWLPEEHRNLVRVASAAALRLRGKHRDSLALITSAHARIRRDHTEGIPRGVWPKATIELAQARLFDGDVKQARKDVATVVDLYSAARLTRHKTAMEARTVAAEADLAIAFTDVNTNDERWRHAADRVAALAAESASWFGPRNSHTLRLDVLYARALHDSTDHNGCLRETARCEPHLVAALGAKHPLYLRSQSTAGSARLSLGEHAHAYEILSAMLPIQVELLGETHPDAIFTRFVLGLAAAASGRQKEAEELVGRAWKLEGGTHGWLREQALEKMAHVGLVTVLPNWLLPLALRIRRGR